MVKLKTPTISKESEDAPTLKQRQLEYNHDTEANTVSFSLSNGTEITVREPRAIDYLRVKGWLDNAPPDDTSEEMAGYKLISLCVIKFTRGTSPSAASKIPISVYELVGAFETQMDFVKAANCMEFFRSTLDRLTGSTGSSVPSESVHPEVVS